MRDVSFKVFSVPANDPGSRVVALRIPGGASMPRSEIDAYTKFVAIYGAKGLAYIKVNDAASIPEGLQRSEEHTYELQSLMRISYAVFCLKQKQHSDVLHQAACEKPSTEITPIIYIA